MQGEFSTELSTIPQGGGDCGAGFVRTLLGGTAAGNPAWVRIRVLAIPARSSTQVAYGGA